MSNEAHQIQIRELWHGANGRTFVAVCSCGWGSDPKNSERKAQDEGDGHVAYTTTIAGG